MYRIKTACTGLCDLLRHCMTGVLCLVSVLSVLSDFLFHSSVMFTFCFVCFISYVVSAICLAIVRSFLRYGVSYFRLCRRPRHSWHSWRTPTYLYVSAPTASFTLYLLQYTPSSTLRAPVHSSPISSLFVRFRRPVFLIGWFVYGKGSCTLCRCCTSNTALVQMLSFAIPLRPGKRTRQVIYHLTRQPEQELSRSKTFTAAPYYLHT